MPTLLPLLSIRCIETDAKYILQFEGANWSEEFSTMENAVLRAGAIVVEETRLTIYDHSGKAVVLTNLFPLTSN
jgi:hypothetical protein